MVPVFHEQAARIGLKFCQHLYHLPGFPVISHEHFQITEIDIKGIFRNAGLQEPVYCIFQAQAVYVLLHVIGNLSPGRTGSVQVIQTAPAAARVKSQILTGLPQESHCLPLQATDRPALPSL